MVTPQLLDYIRQNLATGLARADIEKALVAAGWAVQDITDGFTAIEHPGSAVPPPVVPAPAPRVSPPNDNAAETIRIQKELELEAKLQKWRGATASTPVIGGIIGWLIRKKIVEKEAQANIALIGVAIIAIVLAVGIFVWGDSGSNKPPPTPQELKAMQRTPSPASTPVNPNISS
jgi:hypothetical protein